MLREQRRYNLLFRWFVGLAIDDAVWNHRVFSKNCDRLNDEAVAAQFLPDVVRLAQADDAADFVASCRNAGVTPDVAQNTSGRRRAIDGRTTRHWGYGQRLEIRAWIETHVGWIKAAASLRQVKQRGLARVVAPFQFATTTSNGFACRR